jgi:large subunit ribosomal protein L10
MPRLEKETIVNEIKISYKESPYVFFSSVSGLSVADISELRRALETKAQRAMVVKNSLMKRVLKENGANGEATEFLKDQVLVAFGTKEPQDISKALVDFIKDHEKLILRGAIIEGKIVNSDYVKQLAKLPSKKELLGMVVSGINAPIAGFVLTLGGLVRSFVIALNQVAKKKNE